MSLGLDFRPFPWSTKIARVRTFIRGDEQSHVADSTSSIGSTVSREVTSDVADKRKLKFTSHVHRGARLSLSPVTIGCSTQG